MEKKLVIVGAGEFAEIAYEYFTKDSEYEVQGFAVEKAFRNKETLFGKSIVDFERITDYYSPQEIELFVAITYVKFNTVRKRLYQQCKKMGYKCASYVSSHAFVWHNVKIGENTFIFEDNTIQYYAEIGNNVILWSGNHIGHRSTIGDNCWLTSHVVISGFCNIEADCFLGVNATVCDNITIAKESTIGAGTLVTKNLLMEGQVYIGSPARLMGRTSYEQFGVKTNERD